ncbi:MAG: hypothetical protein WB729_16660, partial [Candidatus Sulfotelmatobacter sp.]
AGSTLKKWNPPRERERQYQPLNISIRVGEIYFLPAAAIGAGTTRGRRNLHLAVRRPIPDSVGPSRRNILQEQLPSAEMKNC